jgi:hypothetical protein
MPVPAVSADTYPRLVVFLQAGAAVTVSGYFLNHLWFFHTKEI